jgi:membrane protein DedA with SNARE-associated domain
VSHFIFQDASRVLGMYGYLAVFGAIIIETSGIPFPGEMMLIIAGALAGASHKLSIYYVIAVAAAGAIAGDNVGFWIGRTGGYRALKKYGKHLHIDEGSMKMGLYLFKRYGSAVVFFARWIPLLRMWGALLAGAYQLEWKRFLIFNTAGGTLWAIFYGVLAFYLGKLLVRSSGVTGYAGLAVAAAIIAAFFIVERLKRDRWREAAEKAFPGPLR